MRYVLEGPAPDPSQPAYDIAVPPSEPVILTGLSLADALDRIGQESARLRWIESDGVIVVRFTPAGTGLLDQRMARYSVTGANARTAMGALVSVLAPAWDQAARVSIWPRPAPNPRSPTPPPDLSTAVVSATMQNTTVGEVLARLARESRSWSWAIHYERLPASIETAQLRLLSGRDVIVASAEGGQDPRRPPTTARTGFDITNQIWPPLAAFADAAGVSVGFEQARGHQASGPAGPRSATLYLGDVEPAAAIARIVARLTLHVAGTGGRFVVFPKSGSSSVLSRTLPSFVRVNEPFLDVVNDLFGRVGAETMRDVQPQALRPGTTGSLEAARQPVTVELREPTTVRAAIEQLCVAVRCNSWAFRAGGPTMGRAGYDLEMHGPNGLSIRRMATLLSQRRPSRRPSSCCRRSWTGICHGCIRWDRGRSVLTSRWPAPRGCPSGSSCVRRNGRTAILVTRGDRGCRSLRPPWCRENSASSSICCSSASRTTGCACGRA